MREPNHLLASNLSGEHVGLEIAVAARILSVYHDGSRVKVRIRFDFDQTGRERLECSIDPEYSLDFISTLPEDKEHP